MKNWETLEADKTRLLTKHFTPGRGGNQIRHITVHHMAMVGGLDECWNAWQSREASAHYTVSPSGEIGQAVWDRDTAWANANQASNQQTIAIEHSNSGGAAEDWPISDATIDNGAHLVAALCCYYKLGRPESGNNVRFHNIESGGITECPYHLRPGQKYHDRYFQRAQYWYDTMTGATTTEQDNTMADTDDITQRLNRIENAVGTIVTQLLGPDGGPNGGRGWEQLGHNANGQNLTLVDGVAAIRHDIANLTSEGE